MSTRKVLKISSITVAVFVADFALAVIGAGRCMAEDPAHLDPYCQMVVATAQGTNWIVREMVGQRYPLPPRPDPATDPGIYPKDFAPPPGDPGR